MTQPFLRKVEVIIGPLPEWKGGGDPNQGIVIRGDGTQENFRIRFSVRKEKVSTATPTVISVYNLTQATREALQTKQAKMTLRVGWDNTGELTTLFTGALLASTTHREGPDLVTDLIGLVGYSGLIRAVVSETHEAGTSLKAIIKKVAKQIPGVNVVDNLINVTDVKIGTSGLSYCCMAQDILDKLARAYGFSWTIVDGNFHALGDGLSYPFVEVVSPANGMLMRAEPHLAGPELQLESISITSLLLPNALPGGKVDLTTANNPILNKVYQIHDVGHTGDTHSSTWFTTLTSYLTFEQGHQIIKNGSQGLAPSINQGSTSSSTGDKILEFKLGPGVLTSQAVETVARQMKVGWADKTMFEKALGNTEVGPNGFNFKGTSQETMNAMSKEFGFQWGVTKNILKVWK